MSYPEKYKITDWLPISAKEVKSRGWQQLDVILFTGDAYIDHPSFGAAVIGRILEKKGLKVAIVPQPNWRDDLRDFKKLGQPRLFFGVTAGSMDSMVNHYTANKRLRSNDAYTAGGQAGARPDYAATVYSSILKELFPDVPIILGGVESSMRRFTHYDYWADELKKSILIDSKADLLVYGMGEKPILQIADNFMSEKSIEELRNIPQIVYLKKQKEYTKKNDDILLNSHEKCMKSKLSFARNFKQIEQESNKMYAKRIVQFVDDKAVIVNTPFSDHSQSDIDQAYDLPYTRLPHPRYFKKTNIPAFEMIKFSVNAHRGCFGGCSFCTISAHQGKFVQSRSEKSILAEIKNIVKMPDFKGYLSDIGGPSANMYKMQGVDLEECKTCARPSCIFPQICSNLATDHKPLLDLYRKAKKIEGIKKIFIGSGIRYDLFFDKKNRIEKKHTEYVEELIKHHVSGRLKVAPEHASPKVLKLMRKPSFEQFKIFAAFFDKTNRKFDLNQQLIPYFISSHPASELEDMADLAVETKKLNFRLEQVQDFTPTPMTLATVIYYTGIHPYTEKKEFIARSKKDKLDQLIFFFWYKKESRQRIKQLLMRLGRNDLINRLLGRL